MRRALNKVVAALDRASAQLSFDSALLETALLKLEPTLSLRTVRARVTSIVRETADTKTYWLRPNARFRGYRPGSFVTLQLAIDGERLQRSYSISSAPRDDGLISITVKRVAGGRVSNWLADTLRTGHVLELSAAQGQFVLPDVLPEKLLMLSAGSGITPVMSMLRHLVASGTPREIKFLHFARTPSDIIFRDELARIAASCPHVRIVHCVERVADEPWTFAEGRFSQAFLSEVAPEFRDLDTFLCGPAGFMGAVLQTFERSGADMSKVRYERFNSAFDPSKFLEHAHVIRFVRSGAQSLGNRPRTILEEAESVGLAVKAGCRAGNCGTCRCRKHSGVVVDITTGSQSQLGEEFHLSLRLDRTRHGRDRPVRDTDVMQNSLKSNGQARLSQLPSAPESDAERIASFGRALDALRREVELELGADDAAHIRRIDELSKRLELVGRGLIYVSFEPVGYGLGVAALWLHKSLELMEIGHMALHGAYDGLAGADRFQADSFVWKAPIDEASWKHGHNVQHHQYTNIAGKDPDLDFGVMRLSGRVGHRSAHMLQPITNSLSWLFFSTAINFHVTGLLERFFKPSAEGATRGAWRAFLGKALRYYGKELVFYPLLAGPFFAKVFFANLATEALRDLCAGAIIYCGHVGARDFAADSQPATRAHWYAMQAEAARDVEVPQAISILCGGLDRQIEHHLFPRLPPNRLRKIAPRVRAICEGHGIRYRTDTWPNTLRAVLHELSRLSSSRAALATS